MWHNQLDAIFVINLLKRKDRRQQAEDELNKYDIPFRFWIAIENENGAEGLRQTMVALFNHCIANGYKRVGIFEDDAVMIEDINAYMPKCLEQLPEDFDLFYLGCQHNQKFERFYSENLLPVASAFSTHAVLWSASGMTKFIERCNGIPIDREIRNKLQSDGKCFASFPMLVSQRPSYSDIEKKLIDWGKWLQDLFKKNTKHLLDGSY